MRDANDSPQHDIARREVRRLVRQMIEVVEPGEHLGKPRRAGSEIVIPLVNEVAGRAAQGSDESIRALLAAWLDQPSV